MKQQRQEKTRKIYFWTKACIRLENPPKIEVLWMKLVRVTPCQKINPSERKYKESLKERLRDQRRLREGGRWRCREKHKEREKARKSEKEQERKRKIKK